MLRRIRIVLFAIAFAVLGSAAGRAAAELRRRMEQGEPLELSREEIVPQPQELVPGLVAALRVGDRPWRYLHIPPWFAAFAVNFAVAALGRELRPLRSSSPFTDPATEGGHAGNGWSGGAPSPTPAIEAVAGDRPSEPAADL